MKVSSVKFVAGFICLFALYHAAEYMIIAKNNPAGFLGFQALFFIIAWVIAKWQFKEGLSAWGLSTKKHFFKHLVLGMLVGITLYGLTYVTNLITGVEVKLAVPYLNMMVKPLLVFVFGNFFASFSEDILTRGYIYRHLNGMINVSALIPISAAVYLLNHINRLGDGIDTYLYLFLLGILFVIPLVLTKRLWFTGGMHWAGNSFFYLTHSLIQTGTGNAKFSANYTLCIWILLIIPFSYYLIKQSNMIEKDISTGTKLKMGMGKYLSK